VVGVDARHPCFRDPRPALDALLRKEKPEPDEITHARARAYAYRSAEEPNRGPDGGAASLKGERLPKGRARELREERLRRRGPAALSVLGFEALEPSAKLGRRARLHGFEKGTSLPTSPCERGPRHMDEIELCHVEPSLTSLDAELAETGERSRPLGDRERRELGERSFGSAEQAGPLFSGSRGRSQPGRRVEATHEGSLGAPKVSRGQLELAANAEGGQPPVLGSTSIEDRFRSDQEPRSPGHSKPNRRDLQKTDRRRPGLRAQTVERLRRRLRSGVRQGPHPVELESARRKPERRLDPGPRDLLGGTWPLGLSG
jgi:hypothetical protein